LSFITLTEEIKRKERKKERKKERREGGIAAG
jgi:hypothetical protein